MLILEFPVRTLLLAQRPMHLSARLVCVCESLFAKRERERKKPLTRENTMHAIRPQVGYLAIGHHCRC